jgi:NADPH:quinone reductase-like Zn-dependent oxidoreductase
LIELHIYSRMPTHLAAVSPAKGQPFEIQTRDTPEPGPGELLIAVKSVALNPADNYMRNLGLLISTYPTVIGFDIAGLVLKIGDNVPNESDGAGLSFQPGITRVAAYAASFWRSCNPDYGAFQERCLVPWQHAVPILDEKITWNQAATLPVSVEVPLNAWDTLGIPRVEETADLISNLHASVGAGVAGRTKKNDVKQEEALLIWGGSSSVGSMGVQSARLLVEDPSSSVVAVYATAGLSNMKYVSSLGADRVFDYKDAQVVDTIVSAAREDGLVIRHCFLAVGMLAPCQAVLKAFLGMNGGGEKTAKIASAPMVPPDTDVADGVGIIFLQPAAEEGERLKQFRYRFGTWLKENLAKGVIKPSPEPKVVGKGLGAINAGLDLLLQGVSCTKLVVEVDE